MINVVCFTYASICPYIYLKGRVIVGKPTQGEYQLREHYSNLIKKKGERNTHTQKTTTQL